jgi:phosphatidylinositol phospholipase C delta
MRMHDQSAGPVLMRKRSDSAEASDGGQDVSDLELDGIIEPLSGDVQGAPLVPTLSRELHNPIGTASDWASSTLNSLPSVFEGGIAPASSAVLENGTWVTKMTKRNKKRVKLWLDPNFARVCWHSTKTSKSFFIDDVREYRVGAQSRNARDDVAVAQDQENLWITIVYDTHERSQGRSIKTMHVMMPDDFLLKLWTDALDLVSRQRIKIMSALSSSTERHEQGMALAWRQAMTRQGQVRDTGFTYDDARWVCRKLEINCTENTVQTHFKNIVNDLNATMDYEMYRKFIQSFRERKEIYHIHGKLAFGSGIKPDMELFLDFLANEQKIDVAKDRPYWEGIFERFAKPLTARPGQGDQLRSQDRLSMTLSVQGLQNFIASQYNGPLVPKINDPTLDRPLNEYYISSSHNTYLLGRQVRGTSSVEGYIATLVKGCRCVEIDCWDGDDGRPMVTHGRTMTTRIPFEDCVSVVARYAFNSSPYPLIISLEVHCNAEQQRIMVELMKKYFKDMMITEPLFANAVSLPSPSELKHKILIKVKASSGEDGDLTTLLTDSVITGRSRSRSLNSSLARAPSSDIQAAAPSSIVSSPTATSPSDYQSSYATRESSVASIPIVTPASSAEESDELPMPLDKSRKKKTSRITPELGKLGVYAQGIKFHGFQDPSAKNYNHIYSLAENVFDKLCARKTDNKALLEKHNVRHLMRVYPNNLRVDSSNFDPLQSWRRGVQMAALNWQYYDVHQQVNEAMFAAGPDRSGYVLKPEELRHANPREKRGRKLVRFTVDLLAAQRLPRPRTQNSDALMNTYIEVEVFCPEDRPGGNTNGESNADVAFRDGFAQSQTPLCQRSRTIEGNGFDPQYNSKIDMRVETKWPSLVFVRWTVWNVQDGRSSSPTLLATYTAKLASLMQGYRLLPLFNPRGEQYRDAKLMVRISKKAPVPVQPGATADQSSFTQSSPRPEPTRSGRSWPLRILRIPSQRKKERSVIDTTKSSNHSSTEFVTSRSVNSDETDNGDPR